MVSAAAPEKLSAWSVPPSIVLPVVETATCTAVMLTGPSPKAFDSRKRRRLPPIETDTIWRRVLLDNPGAGGTFPGSVSCGPQAQVPTQTSPALVEPAAPPVLAAPPSPVPAPPSPPV